jgi:hypothetical protein
MRLEHHTNGLNTTEMPLGLLDIFVNVQTKNIILKEHLHTQEQDV